MRNILILDNPENGYNCLFEEHGNLVYDRGRVEDCDLVVFTGGEDVSPYLYGDNKISTTINNLNRDAREQHIFTLALFMAIPMVGICRGMQFLNVMNGGSIIQDVTNHTNCTHEITTHEGENFDVMGDHHQMCIPSGNYELLAYSTSLSDKYESGGKINIASRLSEEGLHEHTTREPEAIYWPNSNCLGVQYHPEWMEEDSEGYVYFQELLNTYIFNEE